MLLTTFRDLTKPLHLMLIFRVAVVTLASVRATLTTQQWIGLVRIFDVEATTRDSVVRLQLLLRQLSLEFLLVPATRILDVTSLLLHFLTANDADCFFECLAVTLPGNWHIVQLRHISVTNHGELGLKELVEADFGSCLRQACAESSLVLHNVYNGIYSIEFQS